MHNERKARAKLTTWIPKFRSEIPSGTLAGKNSHSPLPSSKGDATGLIRSFARKVDVRRGRAGIVRLVLRDDFVLASESELLVLEEDLM